MPHAGLAQAESLSAVTCVGAIVPPYRGPHCDVVDEGVVDAGDGGVVGQLLIGHSRAMRCRSMPKVVRVESAHEVALEDVVAGPLVVDGYAERIDDRVGGDHVIGAVSEDVDTFSIVTLDKIPFERASLASIDADCLSPIGRIEILVLKQIIVHPVVVGPHIGILCPNPIYKASCHLIVGDLEVERVLDGETMTERRISKGYTGHHIVRQSSHVQHMSA